MVSVVHVAQVDAFLLSLLGETILLDGGVRPSEYCLPSNLLIYYLSEPSRPLNIILNEQHKPHIGAAVINRRRGSHSRGRDLLESNFV